MDSTMRSFAAKDRFGFPLAQIKHLARAPRIRPFETVRRKLLFLRQPYIAVTHIVGPSQLEHAVDVLQERSDSFEPVRELARHGIEIQSPSLLEICELRNLQPVKQHLPSHAPRAERWRFPIVFLEANIVMPQINPNRAQAIQIDVLHIRRRRLKYYLKLRVLV